MCTVFVDKADLVKDVVAEVLEELLLDGPDSPHELYEDVFERVTDSDPVDFDEDSRQELFGFIDSQVMAVYDKLREQVRDITKSIAKEFENSEDSTIELDFQ